MIRLLFLFPKTRDRKEMDDYVTNTWLPSFKELQDLRGVTTSLDALMRGQ